MVSEPKKHARLAPSGYSRWGSCPGSIKLEEPFPNDSNEHSRWGTAAHALAEHCLTFKGMNAEDYVGQKFGDPGEEVAADMEMADCVNDYISHVNSLIDTSHGDEMFVEEQVPLDHMTGEEGATGTSDIIGITDNGKTLVVADLKGGRGVKVEAKNNGQLRMYASGAYRLYGALYPIERIKMAIIQPRLDWFDIEEISVAELEEFENEVRAASDATRGEEPQYQPSEKACRFCKAKGVCPALREEVLTQVTDSREFGFSNLDAELSIPKTLARNIVEPNSASEFEALHEAYRAIPLIETWIKGVRAELERRAFAGEAPGFKIVEGKKGNRAWVDETLAMAELKKRGKLEEIAVIKPISPTVAEKHFKDRPRIWAKLAPLITQKDGAPSVAPESDPRPAISLVSEESSFTNLTADEPAATTDLATNLLS